MEHQKLYIRLRRINRLDRPCPRVCRWRYYGVLVCLLLSWLGWIKVEALGFLSYQDEDRPDACLIDLVFRKALLASSIEHIMSGDCWFGGFGHAHPVFFSRHLVSEGARRSSAGCYYHGARSRPMVLAENVMDAEIWELALVVSV
jgi:hypothetical protein